MCYVQIVQSIEIGMRRSDSGQRSSASTDGMSVAVAELRMICVGMNFAGVETAAKSNMPGIAAGAVKSCHQLPRGGSRLNNVPLPAPLSLF